MRKVRCSAAILIGGRARRFAGRVKSSLLVGNRPILVRQLDALHAAGVDNIVLVGRWASGDSPPAPVVADAIEDAGALGGIYTALLTATQDVVIVLAGDMPFVGDRLMARVAAIDRDSDAVIPQDANGSHPLCAGYRRRIAGVLKRTLDAGHRSVRAATSELRVNQLRPDELAAIDPAGMMLMNVNTPDDYTRACRLADAAAPPRA